MTLHITDTSITSPDTVHHAERPSRSYARWSVSWLPSRILSRDAAVTAMTIAEKVGVADAADRPYDWWSVNLLAAELDLTEADAVHLVRSRAAVVIADAVSELAEAADATHRINLGVR